MFEVFCNKVKKRKGGAQTDTADLGIHIQLDVVNIQYNMQKMYYTVVHLKPT